jgi:hypothetical protein
MIAAIQNWSTQKKVFIALTSATIIAGSIWGIMKFNDYRKKKK